jgi:hypothetical protein
MIYDFIHKDGVIKKSLRFLFFIILFQPSIYSQSVSNLEKFYALVDSASNLLIKDLGDAKKVSLELNLGIDYSIFANQVRGKLLKAGKEIISSGSTLENVATSKFCSR